MKQMRWKQGFWTGSSGLLRTMWWLPFCFLLQSFRQTYRCWNGILSSTLILSLVLIIYRQLSWSWVHHGATPEMGQILVWPPRANIYINKYENTFACCRVYWPGNMVLIYIHIALKGKMLAAFSGIFVQCERGIDNVTADKECNT